MASASILLANPFPYPPGVDLGLGYLATALRRSGYDVRILELAPSVQTPADFAARLRREPPDCIGFKVWSSALPEVRRYLDAAREAAPEVPVVLGGPHATGTGAAVLEQFGEVAFAFSGEAELGLPRLVREILRGGTPRGSVLARIPGLIWRARDGVRVNDQAFPEDLDALGAPAWDLFDFDMYFGFDRASHETLDALRFNWLHVQSTRGCPHHCTYCLAPQLAGHRIRKHSPGAMAAQLTELRDRYGVRFFSFADDNLTYDRPFAVDLFEHLEPLGLRWTCNSNGVEFKTLDEDMVRRMVRSGCEKITVGVESGSERVLKLMGRHYTQQDVHAAVARIRKASDVWLTAFILMGFPGETDDDVRQTLSLISRLDIDQIYVNLFTPWPGTPITKKLQREGWLKSSDLSRQWYQTATMSTQDMPRWRLELYFYLAQLVFYGRPTRMWCNLRRAGLAKLSYEAYLITRKVLRPRSPEAIHFGRLRFGKGPGAADHR